jgi:branched-chain amino acid transport system substrate-binding protein
MKGKFAVLFACLIVANMILAGCTPKATETAPGAGAAVAPEYIEIGASIPLTGKSGALGQQVKVGYEYAIADVNTAGGVFVAEFNKKIPLRLNAIDDVSDPTKASTNIETLNGEGVVALLGGATSGMHAATMAVAEADKIPYLGVSIAWWGIHQRGYKYIFTPFVNSMMQSKDIYVALNEMIPVKENRPLKVAIFEENTDYGIEVGGFLKANSKNFGYTVVSYQTYASGTKDFTTLIQAAQEAGAEALFGSPSPPDGPTIMRGLAQLGWTPKFTMLIRSPDAASWTTTLGKTGDYVSLFASWSNTLPFEGVAEINAKHQADFGRAADVLVGPAYACVQILAAAIENAGTLQRDDIRDAILDTDLDTVIGNVTFNSDGTANILDPLVMWVNGKQEVIWPLEYKTVNLTYPAPAFDQR